MVTTLSTDERQMLISSLQRLLDQQWQAPTNFRDVDFREDGLRLWHSVADQGLLTVGHSDGVGGMADIVEILKILGAGSCPIPFVPAAVANLLLGSNNSDSVILQEQFALLHSGQSAWCLAIADTQADSETELSERGGRLYGKLPFIAEVECASHIFIVLDDNRGALVDLTSDGLMLEKTAGLSEPHWHQVICDGVAFEAIATPGLKNAQNIMQFARSARSLGAARRVFQLALEHAKTRQQFGQVIGRFQAIQHKLADCFTWLKSTELAITKAAEAFDSGDENWLYYMLVSIVYGNQTLRKISLECHHVLGAIGYSEEHEAPRHFRLIHGDLIQQGGLLRAKKALSQWLHKNQYHLPDHDLGEEGNQFRQEVRDWLADYWTPERRDAFRNQPEALREFDKGYTQAMGQQDWHAVSWPKQFGGPGRSPFEQLAFIEELQISGSPRAGRGEIQAHALMNFGTVEQQNEFLPRLRSGEILFCLGYSEPGAGSDLAAMQTRAVREGDDWVINGEKLWTTFAEQADYMWLAAKTDPDASPPHAGISVFIVPMNADGMTIRPSKALYGHNFCTEFFDNVRVPASALVGEENKGWKVITSALATERIQMGGFVSLIRANFERLCARCSQSTDVSNAVVEDKLAELCAEIEVARQLVVHCVEIVDRGQVPVAEAAMSKAFTGELMEKLGEASMDILGACAALSEGAPGAVCDGSLEHMLRRSIMMVIGGGTAEIQRNIIAQRGLDLPR